MFIRKLKSKRGDHTYTYLKLVESGRGKGKVIQKTLVNLGNIDFWREKKVK